jgi:hypothetical protein
MDEFNEKMKIHVSIFFFGVTLLDLGLGEDEESPWFPEGKN